MARNILKRKKKKKSQVALWYTKTISVLNKQTTVYYVDRYWLIERKLPYFSTIRNPGVVFLVLSETRSTLEHSIAIYCGHRRCMEIKGRIAIHTLRILD